MKSIDIIGMMKTASSVVPLEGKNKFLVRWGNNQETAISVENSRPTKRAADGLVCSACGSKNLPDGVTCTDCGFSFRRR